MQVIYVATTWQESNTSARSITDCPRAKWLRPWKSTREPCWNIAIVGSLGWFTDSVKSTMKKKSFSLSYQSPQIKSNTEHKEERNNNVTNLQVYQKKGKNNRSVSLYIVPNKNK